MRVVEEYRGHRILTDGRRFGVERSAGTELRYVTSKDARAEINTELASADYKRNRDESLWLVVPDDSPLACSCCGGRGRSKASRRRRGNHLDCEPEPDAVIALERRSGRLVRIGAVRSIATREYTICEEPPGDADHRQQLERVAAMLRRQELPANNALAVKNDEERTR